jgi:aldose 1-epimerase
MSFSINYLTEDALNLVILKNEKTKTEVSILPDYGALLHRFKITTNGSFYNIIDNYNDDAHLKKELSVSFKSAKLSPFPCRIPGAKYEFNNKEYEFQHRFGDGSAIHGLLYDKPFAVINKLAKDDSASITLQYDYKKDDAGYPFDYRCIIEYILNAEDLLTIKTTISNISKQTIPLADGWHPYFQLGGKVNDWIMQFHASSMVEFNDKLTPTGRLMPYTAFNNDSQIGETLLDNCFVLEKNHEGAACHITNIANGLRISLFPDKNYPYLQIYTPPHRNSIAMENLSGAPDCFNNKMGLLLLEPGDSQTFTVGYKIDVE